MQDIARIDGWVKVDRPEAPLPEFEFEVPEEDSEDSEDSDSAEQDSEFAEPHSDFAELQSGPEATTGSQQPITDSSGMVTYDHTPDAEQLPVVVETLPDDVLEYNSSPISQWAVPVLPLDLQPEGGDEYENLGSQYVQAESQLVSTESEEAEAVSGSDDVDSISTDADEEDESSLLLADVSPQELCTYGCLALTFGYLLLMLSLHKVASTASLSCLVTCLGAASSSSFCRSLQLYLCSTSIQVLMPTHPTSWHLCVHIKACTSGWTGHSHFIRMVFTALHM